MKRSKLFAVNARDIARAFIIAFIYAFLEVGQQALTAHPHWGDLATWSTVFSVSLKTAISYVVLNFFTKPPTPPPSPIGKG